MPDATATGRATYAITLMAATPASLPTCTASLNGQVAYVTSPPSLWACNGTRGTWREIVCDTPNDGSVAYASTSQLLVACINHAWITVALPPGPPGDAGPPGPQGDAGPPGLNEQVTTTALPVGDTHCPNGGYEIQFWLDLNGDGVMDPSEVQSTAYACNGATGASANPCSPNPCLNGGTCANGGVGGFTCMCLTGFGGPTCADVAAVETLMPAVGPPTTRIAVTGASFGPSEAIDVFFDTTDVALATTTVAGAFTANVVAPATAMPGTHWVTAVSRATSRSAQASFLVRTDWPKFHFDDLNSAFNPYENVLSASNISALHQVWTAAVPYGSSVAVDNGVAYVTSAGDPASLFAFDANGCGAASCSPLWTAPIGSNRPSGSSSSPTVANGLVYVDTTNGAFYAFNASGCGASTCSPLWSATTGSTQASPAVANGVVYVASSDHNLYAFNASGCMAATCTPLWTGTTGGALEDSTPAIAGGIVYVGSDDRNVYAFNASGCGAATCSPLWTAITGAIPVLSSPTVANGILYVSTDDGHLDAFNAGGCGAATCSPLWTATLGGYTFSSPSVADGVVYVGSVSGMSAFNAGGCGAATCAPLWTSASGSGATLNAAKSSPAVANGVVYVGSQDGTLFAFNASGCGAATCAPIWSATTGGPIDYSPAVVNGTVYVASNDGNLYVYDPPIPSTARPDPRDLVISASPPHP